MTVPAVFGGISKTEDGEVTCLRCKRPVDHVRVEWPHLTTDENGLAVKRRTGEVILTIECHGEKWKASNWYGVLNT